MCRSDGLKPKRLYTVRSMSNGLRQVENSFKNVVAAVILSCVTITFPHSSSKKKVALSTIVWHSIYYLMWKYNKFKKYWLCSGPFGFLHRSLWELVGPVSEVFCHNKPTSSILWFIENNNAFLINGLDSKCMCKCTSFYFHYMLNGNFC